MRGRVNEIDLLRFIAAVSVVLFHYAFRGYVADNLSVMPYPLLAPAAKYGYLGVQLFFLISGFVILMTASSDSCRKFLISRAVRLYPAFWACCTLTFIAALTIGGHRYAWVSLGQYGLNMTLFSGFFNVPSMDLSYWSLYVEIQFYALIALLLLVGKIKWAPNVLDGWLLMTLVMHWVPRPPILRTLVMVDYAPYFVGGATAYLVWAHGLSLRRIVTYAVALMAAILHCLPNLAWRDSYYHVHYSRPVTVAIIAACFGVMLLVALRKTGPVAQRQWLLLGALTYPLYLLHQGIGFMIFNRAYPAINAHVLLWGTFTAMLLAAYLVHRWIERPFAPHFKAFLERRLGLIRNAVPKSSALELP